MQSPHSRPNDFINSPTHPSQAIDTPITPSKPVPAEHPSAPPTPNALGHSSKLSADGVVSPRTIIHEKRPSEPTQSIDSRRAKSMSLSLPVLANNSFDHRRVTSQTQLQNTAAAASRSNGLKISIPSSGDTSFLTALAAQERHVLELKETLFKAEEELSRLKRQWVSQESKKRQSEARGVHRLTMTATPTSARPMSFSASSGPPSVDSMYEEMHRRKQSWGDNNSTSAGNAERPPRRRFFSGSRQLRSLSLVTPPIMEGVEDSEGAVAEAPQAKADAEDVLLSSPVQLPPTPDLIEEEEDTDPSTSSTRSSRSPARERMARSSLRTSMQMAADFREGLWTFFEDLKQAAVGEEARGSEGQSPGFSDKEVVASPTTATPSTSTRSPSAQGGRPKKQTVKRQTWQFRPNDAPSDAPLVDISGSFWKEQGIAEREEPETAVMPLQEQSSKSALREQEHDGEVWQTWDTPVKGSPPSRSNSATPLSTTASRKGSLPLIDATAAPPKPSNGEVTGFRKSSTTAADASTASTPRASTNAGKEHFRRDSMAWPVLDKLKPGQLRQGMNSLFDDWERSLTAPAQRTTGLRQASPAPRAASPRPVTQRSNSRLDDVYQ